MHPIGKRIILLVLTMAATSKVAAEDAFSASPENQVFQFMTSGSFTLGEGTKRTATAYLWIPPACRQVRGVLVAGRNVPEHGLVGHPAIRAACADSDLAILWCCPTFYVGQVKDGKRHGEFLQQLLVALAARSGYDELATVPWLPIGESYHLGMVKQTRQCVAGTLYRCRADQRRLSGYSVHQRAGPVGHRDLRRMGPGEEGHAQPVEGCFILPQA